MPLFKRFSRPKRELEVTPRAAYTYDCDSDTSSSSVTPGELVYPALQPYVDRGSLLASVLNESLATVLDRLGKYSYSANLAATPKILTLYSDKNPDKCMFATPHMVATISASSGVSWGWSQAHSASDIVVRALLNMGKRDHVRELKDPEIKFPPGWPPKGRKAKNEALAVLAHQLGVAAVGIRLGPGPGATMARHTSAATTSSYSTYISSNASEAEGSVARSGRATPCSGSVPRSPVVPGTPLTPLSPGMPVTPTSGSSMMSTYQPYDPTQISPYFVAPRGNNYAVFLLDFGPSILRTRKTLAEVAPSIRRHLSNGPPVKDQREAFRGLARGMGWSCEESTTMVVQPHTGSSDLFSDDTESAYRSTTSISMAQDENVKTTMHITDGPSSLDVTFDGAGRLTSIKMQLAD